jgi:hypothetical protein
VIRLVFRQVDNTHVAGGAADYGDVTLQSFDVELPEIEEWIKASHSRVIRHFVGMEILPKPRCGTACVNGDHVVGCPVPFDAASVTYEEYWRIWESLTEEQKQQVRDKASREHMTTWAALKE